MDKTRKKAAKEAGEPRTAPSLGNRLNLRITDDEKVRFKEAARRQGITLSQWLRLAAWQVLNEHEGKVKLLDLEE